MEADKQYMMQLYQEIEQQRKDLESRSIKNREIEERLQNRMKSLQEYEESLRNMDKMLEAELQSKLLKQKMQEGKSKVATERSKIVS